MMNLFELNPQTAQVVKRLIVELAAYKRRYRTRRSTPVILGSRSPVIINPTMKQTQLANDDNEPTAQATLRPKSKESEVPSKKIHRPSVFE